LNIGLTKKVREAWVQVTRGSRRSLGKVKARRASKCVKEATIIVPTVIALYKQTDDLVAAIEPGEVLHLEFAAPLAEQAAGSTRRFVIETRVWCKDTDPFTKDADTVEPMPHRDKALTITIFYRISASRWSFEESPVWAERRLPLVPQRRIQFHP
jgi:hypothetical protein